MKRKRGSRESCSAERPVPKVAYIDCPRESWHRSPEAILSKAIKHAVDVGATIINLTFDRETDVSGQLSVANLAVRKVFSVLTDAWGGPPGLHKAGAVLSLFATAHWDLLVSEECDPEGACPALILTLRERDPMGQLASPGLQLSIVTLAWPYSLAPRAKDRLLEAYKHKVVERKSDGVLIGGVFGRLDGSKLWLENRAAKLDFDIRLESNESLCALSWCTTGEMRSSALDSTGPYALVMEYMPSSAERPAASTATHQTHRRLENPAPPVLNDMQERSASAERPAASSALPRGTSSAERPAASADVVHPARVFTLNPATPLYDKLLHDLQHTPAASSLMRHIEVTCFSDKLRFVSTAGTHVPEAIPFTCKMESLLRTAMEQRVKIAKAAGIRKGQFRSFRATPAQMQAMYNNWRKNVGAWMSPENQHWYYQLLRWNRVQQAHQLTKTCGTWTLIGMDSL